VSHIIHCEVSFHSFTVLLTLNLVTSCFSSKERAVRGPFGFTGDSTDDNDAVDDDDDAGDAVCGNLLVLCFGDMCFARSLFDFRGDSFGYDVVDDEQQQLLESDLFKTT
jgi:hypothetical protein